MYAMSAFSPLSVRYRDNDQTAQGQEPSYAYLRLPPEAAVHPENLGGVGKGRLLTLNGNWHQAYSRHRNQSGADARPARTSGTSLEDRSIFIQSPPRFALFSSAGACCCEIMTPEDERVPLSTEVSPLKTELDPNVSRPCDSESWQAASLDSAASDERLAIGERLSGRYRIERVLGVGGMGVVYLARDEQVAGETYAIKVLKEGLHPEALELLREEVRKTRKLSHPNIVDVHSVNVDGRRLYVLMEHLEGKSLDALLNEEFGRGMPFSHVWPIIEDVGAALGNAHDHNVIHSDLKPANVFVTTSGRTKLLDFGIARVSRGPLLHARSGPLALTPEYASCEMLEGKEADRRDDVYSFACVIYEMLCGERPFGELTALEARNAGTKVPPLQGLSRGQNEALARALSFEREARSTSVERLLEGLAAAQPARSLPAALLGAVVIALVATVGLTYWAFDRLWASRHSVVVERATWNAQQAAASPKSIAVLPFADMSEKHDQEYFSDGLAEELLDLLAKTPGLHVIARTSSFSFKGKSEDIPTIATKLHVANILEGSVRKSGDRLRVTTQLIRASNGEQLWSETYDRELKDVFAVQDEIAAAVVRQLKLKLAPIPQSAEHRTSNIEAYNEYLLGREFANRSNLDGWKRAIEAYRRAIALDPNYVAPYDGLALAEYYVADDTADAAGYQRAQAAAEKAVELGPDDPNGYAARGFIRLKITWDWAGAQADYEKAIALDPGDARFQQRYGNLLATLGRLPEAIAAANTAIELDPLKAISWENLSEYLLSIGDFAAAHEAIRRALEINPASPYALNDLGALQLFEGKAQDSLATFRRNGAEYFRLYGIAMAAHTLRDPKASRQALDELIAKYAADSAYQVAEVYAWRGERDKAFQWLERAYAQRDGGLTGIKFQPLLDSLRSDPRYRALMRKMKLPD
jgi:TolB-like protein/cytochrome c-type biogenesis protein CcmH/NrfG